MKNWTGTVRVLGAVLLILLGVVGQGRGETYGTITCSSPEVFTRSRLVDARYRETQWLQGQLDKVNPIGFQGGTDVRITSAFRASAQGTMDPLMGAEERAQQANVNGMTNAIGALTPPDLATNMVSAPIDPNTLATVAGKFTELPIDQIKDQMAARDYIEQMMTEKQLDDTHDLYGSTLYTLKFNVGVHPGNDTKAYAMVFMTASVEDPAAHDSKKAEDLKKEWVKNYVQIDLDREAEKWIQRLDGNASDAVVGRLVEKYADKALVDLEKKLSTCSFDEFSNAVREEVQLLPASEQEQELSRVFPCLQKFGQVFHYSQAEARIANAFNSTEDKVIDAIKVNAIDRYPDSPILQLIRAHHVLVPKSNVPAADAQTAGAVSPAALPPPASVASVTNSAPLPVASPTPPATVSPRAEEVAGIGAYDADDFKAVLKIALTREIIEMRATLREYVDTISKSSEPKALQSLVDAQKKAAQDQLATDQAKAQKATTDQTVASHDAATRTQNTAVVAALGDTINQLQVQDKSFWRLFGWLPQNTTIIQDLQKQQAALPTTNLAVNPQAPDVKPSVPAEYQVNTTLNQDSKADSIYFYQQFTSRIERAIILSTYEYRQVCLKKYIDLHFLLTDKLKEGGLLSEDGFFTPTIVTNENTDFRKALATAEGGKLRICEVAPNELAEDISRSVTQDTEFAFNLAFAGRLTEGATLGAAADYIHQKEQMAQAIDRHPLIVSFTDAANQFGWILGPSFSIDEDNNPVFLQKTVDQSVTASLSVPGWVGEITLTGWYMWINDNGKPLAPAHPLWTRTILNDEDGDPLPRDTSKGFFSIFQHHDGDRPAQKDQKPLPVELAGDLSTLTPALIDSNVLLDRKPILTLLSQTLQNGLAADQTLLISGTEVWRNPIVFVGSVKADSIDILPDMKNLAAHFTKPITLAPGTYPLTVITSVASDTLADAVTVQAPNNPTGLTPFAVAKDTRLKPGSPTTFTFPQELWPKAYSGIVGRLTIGTAAPLADIPLDAVTDSGKRTITIPALTSNASAVSCKLDLLYQATSTDKQTSMLTDGPKTVVLFPNDTDKLIWSKASVTQSVSPTDQLLFTVSLNDKDTTPDWTAFEKLLAIGYPALNGFVNPTMHLELKPTTSMATILPLQLQSITSNDPTIGPLWQAKTTAQALGLATGSTTVFNADVIVGDSTDNIPILSTATVAVTAAAAAPATK